MQQAKVKSEFANGMLRFSLAGEIDHCSAVGLREAIDRELYLHDARVVVLCLDGVEFMDSSGLGLILGRYTRLRERGITLRLENPSQQVSKILRMAGVDRLVPIDGTKNAAKTSKGVKKQ